MNKRIPKMDKMQTENFAQIPLPSVDSEDSIENMFRNEQNAMQNDIKELFHEDKVKARTDISARQIKLITKAFYLAKITGMKEINAILSDFLVLSISKDRKSRAEYVEGLRAKIDNALQQGAINMRGQFGK
jgi:flagellar biosynthesis GTPase FlhF